ncbi:hypothetical protein MMC12_000077 [Toensbergia leucococca]|nr:hypothetical protein [Toensbergia leucococca]
MVLVDYLDSDDSDIEQSSPQPQNINTTTTKPAFKKVVDPSNPHKIRISLPEPTRPPHKDASELPEPPAKRARIGAGGLGGFNSFLPAPKRSSAANGGPARRKGGLGSGVNLKTGATPGFSREPMLSADAPFEGSGEAGSGGITNNPESNLTENGYDTTTLGITEPPATTSKEEPKKQGNAMMFKPLSVARKPQKKKPPLSSSVTDATATQKPTPVPRLSLFSLDASQEGPQTAITPQDRPYKPLLHNPATTPPPETPLPSTLDSNPPPSIPSPPTPPETLTTLAKTLNLSASAKRQLLGRQHTSASSNQKSQIKIANFNTDQEYAANELLRQAGEQVQHNPVRAIAPGKHSLQQLVNAASSQKDALEEQFASGKRNKQEAGSKYGW